MKKISDERLRSILSMTEAPATLNEIDEMAEELLQLRHQTEHITDGMIERAARSLCVSSAEALGYGPTDPDEISFRDGEEVGPVWMAYKNDAYAAIKSALSNGELTTNF